VAIEQASGEKYNSMEVSLAGVGGLSKRALIFILFRII
jgi:hypothetical protein